MADRRSDLYAVTSLFLGLTWLSVSLRCWVRVRIIKSFGLDDWLTVVALLLFTTFCAFVYLAIDSGTGLPTKELSPSDRLLSMKAWFFGEVFYIISSTELRLTIGIFLLKFSVRKSQKAAIHILNFINVAYNIYYLVQACIQCTPVSFYWTRVRNPRSGGTCVDPTVSMYNTYTQAALAIFTDWAFALLPIWLLRDLKLTTKKKISVGVVLALGTLGSTATIVKFPYIVSLAHPHDFLYETIDVALWSIVEVGIGLTCISLATLRPILRGFLIRIGLSSGRDTTYPYGNNSHGYMRHNTGDALPLKAFSPGQTNLEQGRLGENSTPWDPYSGASTTNTYTQAPLYSPNLKVEKGSFWNVK